MFACTAVTPSAQAALHRHSRHGRLRVGRRVRGVFGMNLLTRTVTASLTMMMMMMMTTMMMALMVLMGEGVTV
jgi:hypothetical protein